MTLIVSLRIPDGVVIAGDSLATMMSKLQAQVKIDVKCPECGFEHPIETQLDTISMPSTTFSYAQKVFPFLRKYGIGTFGSGQLAGKTIYFAMRELENQIQKSGKLPNGVSEVAQIIGKPTQNLLKKQLESEGKNINDAPDDWSPLGFQVVGYDDDQAVTIEVKIGKKLQVKEIAGSGCTVSGSTAMVELLFQLYAKQPAEKPVYALFSLQDAITYAEFLIGTTASHQQFSRTIPKVGGQIDVGLVTPFDEYQWIRRKSLHASLEGGNG